MSEKITCHDCEVAEGLLHQPGCDMECCPFCGHQLISCDCCYTKLGFNPDPQNEKRWSDKLEGEWGKILNERGRIPYIQYPVVCAKCGALYPGLFMVPDDEWCFYIQLNMRSKIVCLECYAYIKQVIDGGAYALSNNMERL